MCKEEISESDHICPYAEDINGDNIMTLKELTQKKKEGTLSKDEEIDYFTTNYSSLKLALNAWAKWKRHTRL